MKNLVIDTEFQKQIDQRLKIAKEVLKIISIKMI
jgi:hypothetical protein